jgi:ATP-dependent RNA helicase RhlE
MGRRPGCRPAGINPIRHEFNLTTFTDLGLAAPLLKALAAEGYETPTPIQAQAVPTVLTGRDLLGVAQTGTGKTAAFALPILQRLDADRRPTPRKGCRTLILSPTRELASQIAESFRTYGRFMGLSVAVIFGGVSMSKQIREMASGVDILVATPGRLLDLVGQRALGLSNVEILVLDEADQMLDMGFIHDIRRLAALIPAKRQTLLFSATMPKEIGELADRFLTDPVKVAVAPVATTAERVDQHVVFVDAGKKQALLHALVAQHAMTRALVFTRTKHGADKVVRRLADAGIAAAAIHGNKSQPQRERALAEFKAGRLHLLVATDIAARGIDIDNVGHVVNFDLPNVPESYVHRIGRTARAGAEGMAISFCDGEERAFLRDIERLTRQKVPVMPAPEGLAALPPSENRRDERGPRPQQGRPGAGRPAHRASAGGQPQGRGAQGNGHPAGQGRGQRNGQPGAAASGQGRPSEKPRREEATPSRWHAGTANPMQPRGESAPRRRDNRFGSR